MGGYICTLCVGSVLPTKDEPGIIITVDLLGLLVAGSGIACTACSGCLPTRYGVVLFAMGTPIALFDSLAGTLWPIVFYKKILRVGAIKCLLGCGLVPTSSQCFSKWPGDPC